MNRNEPTRSRIASTDPTFRARRLFGLAVVACAVTLVCDPVRAATPGLPFNEDFADDSLIDAAGTTAARVASKQAMQLMERSTWNQPVRNRAFRPPANTVNSLPMNTDGGLTTDVALGDVNHDGNLDMVVVYESAAEDFYNRICIGDGTGVMAGSGASSCSTYDLLAGFASDTESVLLVDVNHDGHLDIIEGRDGGQNRLNLGHGNGTFAAGTTIGSETDSTRDLHAADMDHDGNLDLVVANSGATNKVYFGDGSGGFDATGTDIGSETESTLSIALGDLDRDGDIDVVAANGAVKRVYLNDGSGGFAANGTDIGLDSDNTRRIALADFTSDGLLDLVLANNSSSPGLKIYPGDGNGGFTDAGPSIGGSGSFDMSLGIDDFDGNGHLDLVVFGGSVEGMYLGDGTGGFSTKGNTLDLELQDTVSIAVGDVDNDGSPDVVLPQKSTTVSNHVYLNSPGTGFDDQGLDLIPIFATETHALKLADVDGDGDLDVVTGRLGDTDAIYINQFDGEFDLFQSPTFNAAFFDGPNPIASSGTNTTALDLGDVDGDGILDLVTGDINGPKKLFLGNGTGGFVYQGDFGTAEGDSNVDIRLADIDDDGDLDVLVANLDGFGRHNRFYLNDGAGNFPASGMSIGSEVEDSSGIAVGDIDGDGNMDVVVANFGSAPNRLYLGDGDGAFSASGTAIGTTHYDTRAIELHDFDGDGDLDVIAGNRNHVDRVYLNDGGGNFPGNGNSLESSRSGDTRGLLVDDVNNDAIPDVVGIETNATALYIGDGNGGIARTVSLGVGGNTADGSGALGDIDRDGDLDLIKGSFNQQDYIYFNEFDGGSFDGLTEAVGSGSDASRGATWIDANGDHWPDLAVANDGGTNRLYLGSAAGFSGGGSAIGFDVDSSQAIAQADFDHDGAMDLVVANVGGQVRLYSGNGSGGFAAGVAVGSEFDNSRAISVGDIDRDGNPDIVVGNDGQSNRFYLGDGAGNFSANGADIGSEVDATWSIALADMNLDGRLDLVAGNAGQTNKLYTGDGAGGFNNSVVIGAESDTTRGIAVADLNDDGRPDVVTGNDGEPNRYYLGDGAGNFSASGVDLGPENEATHAIALTDIGADGDHDVVAGNLGEANRLYLNNGALDFGSVAFDAVSGANQTRGVLAGDSDRDGDVDVFSFNDGQVNRQLVQSGYLAHANVVTSKKINDAETGITELRLTASVFGEHDNRYYLSNDDGATWHRVQSGADFTFPSPGDDVRWRAELIGGNRVMPPSLLAVEIAVPSSTGSEDGSDSGGDSGSNGGSGSSGESGSSGGGGGSASPWFLLWLCAIAGYLHRNRRHEPRPEFPSRGLPRNAAV